jgi:hypothetical protein
MSRDQAQCRRARKAQGADFKRVNLRFAQLLSARILLSLARPFGAAVLFPPILF